MSDEETPVTDQLTEEAQKLGEYLTADELEALRGATEVEVEPRPTEYPLYVCPKGHKQAGSGETVATNPEFPNGVSTGPVCVACYILDQVGKYPTAKMEAPAEPADQAETD